MTDNGRAEAMCPVSCQARPPCRRRAPRRPRRPRARAPAGGCRGRRPGSGPRSGSSAPATVTRVTLHRAPSPFCPHLEGEAVGAGPVDGEALLGAVELSALAPAPALRPAVETLARVPALGHGAVRCLHVHLLPYYPLQPRVYCSISSYYLHLHLC